MAIPKARPAPERDTDQREDDPVEGKQGLERLADLTRKVLAVPKAEVPDTTKAKVKRKRSH
jgi:hypothetical protein